MLCYLRDIVNQLIIIIMSNRCQALSSAQERFHKKIRRSYANNRTLNERKKIQTKLYQTILTNYIHNLSQITVNQLVLHLRGWQSEKLEITNIEIDRLVEFLRQFQEIQFEFITLLFQNINEESQKGLLASGLLNLIKITEVKQEISDVQRLKNKLLFISKVKRPSKQFLSNLVQSNIIQAIYQHNLVDYLGAELLKCLINLVKKQNLKPEDAFFQSFLNSLKYIVSNIQNQRYLELTGQFLLYVMKQAKEQIFETLNRQNLIQICLSKFMNTSEEELSALNKIVLGFFMIYNCHPKLSNQSKDYIRNQFCQNILPYQMAIVSNQNLGSSIKQSVYGAINNLLFNQQISHSLSNCKILSWLCQRVKAEVNQQKCLIKIIQCINRLCDKMEKGLTKFENAIIDNKLIQELISIAFNNRFNPELILGCLQLINQLLENPKFINVVKSHTHYQTYFEHIVKEHDCENIKEEVNEILKVLDLMETDEEG